MGDNVSSAGATKTVCVETYSDEFFNDILALVGNFYNEAVKCYDIGFDKDVLTKTITKLKATNAGNAFLLIINGRCEGILAGMEAISMLNKKRTFQEIIWYINQPHRFYGVALMRKAEAMLKADGFDAMIMGVLEASKPDKLKRFYERMGFKLFESQYIRSLK